MLGTMIRRKLKILTAGLVAGAVILFAPQEFEFGARAVFFLRRLGWAAMNPDWSWLQRGALRPTEIWLTVTAVLIAALVGGAVGGVVCPIWAHSRKQSFLFTASFAFVATACFIWAPYQMGYFQAEKPKDLLSLDIVPYMLLAVFTVWLAFQNVLRFRTVDRTLRTSLVTLGGSILTILVSIPSFFYSLTIGMAVHDMFWWTPPMRLSL